MSLVAGLLKPRLFSSKLSKLKVTEKYSGSATIQQGLSCTWTYQGYRSLCYIWMYLDYRSLCCSWTCLHYRGICFTCTCLHHTGPWAVPGHVWKIGAYAGQDVSSEVQCKVLGCTWRHYRGMCCSWTCLDNRSLCCCSACLHHGGLSCTCKYFDIRSLSHIWTYLA